MTALPILPHDADGFLIGGERLVTGLDDVKKDTSSILALLKNTFEAQVKQQGGIKKTLERISRNTKPTKEPMPVNAPVINTRPTVDSGLSNSSTAPRMNLIHPNRVMVDSSASPTPRVNLIHPNRPTVDSGTPEPTPDTRQRDANGRFLSSDSTSNANAPSSNEKKQSWWDRIKKAVSGGMTEANIDDKNIDPTIDALHELKDAFSPLFKVGKVMFKGAAWLFGRKKRQPPISDQDQRQQTRIEKLLKRIAGSSVGSAARSGMNLFAGIGGALGSLGGMIAPLLMRALIPALGLTAAFKLGQWVGEKIYSFIEPALSPLIDGIAAIPDTIGKAWQSVIDIASKGIEAVVDGFKSAKDKVTGAYDATVEAASNGIEKAANGAQGFFNWGKGVYQGAVAKTSQGMEYVADKVSPSSSAPRSNKSPSTNFTPDKAKSIKETAGRLGVSPNDLAQIISFESGGSFDPAKKNMAGGSATGLIQFMPDTAKGMGTTTADLGKMTFDEQMVYVERYFKGRGIGKNGKKTSIADMYNAVQGVPETGYKKGSKAYAANEIWDVDKDGVIMPNEAVQGKGFQAHARNYFPSESPQFISSPKPAPMVATNQPTQTPTKAAPPLLARPTFTPTKTATATPNAPKPAPMVMQKPITDPQKVQQQVSSKADKNKQSSSGASQDGIGQNLSDRHLAHAVTGGLGMDGGRFG